MLNTGRKLSIHFAVTRKEMLSSDCHSGQHATNLPRAGIISAETALFAWLLAPVALAPRVIRYSNKEVLSIDERHGYRPCSAYLFALTHQTIVVANGPSLTIKKFILKVVQRVRILDVPQEALTTLGRHSRCRGCKRKLATCCRSTHKSLLA
jgi:hypothetical protein